MGNPISQSKSPWIHAAFAEQTGQDMAYHKLLVPVDEFAARAEAFFADGGKGLNVTVPFKLDACEFAKVLSPRATLAGSVNTLSIGEDSRVCGDNTDGVGIVRDLLDNHNVQLEGKRLLILGAGGAVRGVLGPLLDQAPARVTIVNRTEARAVHLASMYAAPERLSGCGFAALGDAEFDLIINGTAASLAREVPPIPVSVMANSPACYDMMYGATATSFNQWAAAHGAGATIDGLGMLVEQAAESFFIWRGVRPECAPVIDRLRSQLTRKIQQSAMK
jgi:shikimate dehydrogenase